MNKRKVHHYYTKVRWIKPWYFLVLALISGLVCILALRANNEHMIVLRDAVYAADKNNTDLKAPLADLQAYVTTHMNTNLSSGKTSVYPPIQLKYTYERLQAAQNAQLAKGTSLYNEAQKYCESQNATDFSGRNRVPCIQQYVEARSTAKAPPIPDSLYKFSFSSPRWSPDLAGWSMLIAILSVIAFILTSITRLILKRAGN